MCNFVDIISLGWRIRVWSTPSDPYVRLKPSSWLVQDSFKVFKHLLHHWLCLYLCTFTIRCATTVHCVRHCNTAFHQLQYGEDVLSLPTAAIAVSPYACCEPYMLLLGHGDCLASNMLKLGN